MHGQYVCQAPSATPDLTPRRLQLPEEDELTWDDGSANPERCLDDYTLVTTVRPDCC